MNKFYTYILPVCVIVISLVISVIIDNQFVVYGGFVVSLIWLNRIAAKYDNKILKIITLLAIMLTVIWTIGLLMWASSW